MSEEMYMLETTDVESMIKEYETQLAGTPDAGYRHRRKRLEKQIKMLKKEMKRRSEKYIQQFAINIMINEHAGYFNVGFHKKYIVNPTDARTYTLSASDDDDAPQQYYVVQHGDKTINMTEREFWRTVVLGLQLMLDAKS
jgi:hypothetical protein